MTPWQNLFCSTGRATLVGSLEPRMLRRCVSYTAFLRTYLYCTPLYCYIQLRRLQIFILRSLCMLGCFRNRCARMLRFCCAYSLYMRQLYHFVLWPSFARTSAARRFWLRLKERRVFRLFLFNHLTALCSRRMNGLRCSLPPPTVALSRARRWNQAFSIAFRSGECLGCLSQTSMPQSRNAAKGS